MPTSPRPAVTAGLIVAAYLAVAVLTFGAAYHRNLSPSPFTGRPDHGYAAFSAP